MFCTEPGAHGGDIEAEEGAADGAEGGEDVLRDVLAGWTGVGMEVQKEGRTMLLNVYILSSKDSTSQWQCFPQRTVQTKGPFNTRQKKVGETSQPYVLFQDHQPFDRSDQAQ